MSLSSPSFRTSPTARAAFPYVHGKEIDSFDRLILLGKEHYEAQGFEIHYETVVSSINLAEQTVEVPGQPAVRFDRLILGTGFEYQRPDIPGAELDGLYYVRDIRAAERWDKLLETVKRAVIAEAQPIGVEMATALAHRGIETHLVDPHPVGHGRDRRPGHHGAGGGVVARAGRAHPSEHRRSRRSWEPNGSMRSRPPTGRSPSTWS